MNRGKQTVRTLEGVIRVSYKKSSGGHQAKKKKGREKKILARGTGSHATTPALPS
jgi:hypothetical protein